MITRKVFLVWIGMCIVCSINSTQAITSQNAAPRRYHSKEYGFSVTIPAGWKEAPRELMALLQKETYMQSTEVEVKFLAGFLSASRQAVPEAFVLVGVVHYPKGRQLSKRDMRRMVSLMTGARAKEICRSAGPDSLASNIKAVTDWSTEYFEDKKMCIWQFRGETNGCGSVQSRNAGFFGRKALVIIAANIEEAQFNDYKHIFAGIENSFQFDPGMEYEDIPWYDSRGFALAIIVVSASVLIRVVGKTSRRT